ncbi:hypothetical protein ES703_34186 [subsurface metagenome]
MRVIKKIYDGIGLLSEWSGRVARFVIIILIVIITYEVMMRYVFNAPTFWQFDISCMLEATFACVGFAYLHYHRGHVRVDVIYTRFSPKGKLITDIVFTLIFFFPLYFLLTMVFIKDALFAYEIQETTMRTYWYPITWPYKSLVALGFSFLCLQGIATFLKDVMALAKGGKEPW